jgi:hypothetical protein
MGSGGGGMFAACGLLAWPCLPCQREIKVLVLLYNVQLTVAMGLRFGDHQHFLEKNEKEPILSSVFKIRVGYNFSNFSILTNFS